MNFRKSSKRPLTPPPHHFRKIILRISRQKCVISRQKCVCSLWRDCYILYDHISHEMHVVQQFNMEIGWKTYPEKTICIIFMLKKPYSKAQIWRYNILDSKLPQKPAKNVIYIMPFHPSITWSSAIMGMCLWSRTSGCGGTFWLPSSSPASWLL